MTAKSWCLTCGGPSALRDVGPEWNWQCAAGHRWMARRCPTCGHCGRGERDGSHLCEGPVRHRFWAATRFCRCGEGVPVCPEAGDIWVCEACDRFEVVSL